LGVAIAWSGYAVLAPVDEVVLTIGEPYEQVRRQSRSTLPAPEANANWFGVVARPTKLRFVDPQYSFITPAAKFFVVSYNAQGNVESLSLSPQVETLPLDEAIAILLDLQDQLRRGGWTPILVSDHPPIEDTPTMRALIRNNDAPQTFWLAGDKYEVYLSIRRFHHDARPKDERYLITLHLSGPPLMEDLPCD
jgi:hypothetical protein